MGDCPFCRITRGEEATEIIHADEEVVAFLDARPIRPGHSLVVPRHHAPTLYELDPVVAHAHVHVVPMLDYHDITSKRLLNGEVVPATPDELSRQASVLRGHG